MASAGGSAQPLIVAHRGASGDAPENTLAAFALAWQQGADGIECDVYLTADGRVVCIHDPTTGRTSGGEAGTGPVVAESKFVGLQAVDVGAWKHPRYTGQRIPLLGDVLAAVPEGKRVFIEVKAGPEIVPALFEVLEQSGLRGEQVVVIAFDDAVVRACKARLAEDDATTLSQGMPGGTSGETPGGSPGETPEVIPGALAGMRVNWLTDFEPDEVTLRPTLGIAEVLDRLEANGADGLGCKARADVVDAAFVERLRAAGYGFHVWTVDHPATARAFADLGVDSITTNHPAWLRRQLTRGSDE